MSPGMEVIGPVTSTGADAVLSPLLDQVREYIRASKSENTLRGYQSDWRAFCAWCESRALCPLPANPETVATFIAECAGRLKVGSVQRRLNAIAEAHKAVGLESPTRASVVINTMKGIRRTRGTTPVQKTATLIDDIRGMVDATDAGLIGARDRALILLGFAGAFRRSELVGLSVGDCAFGKDGLTVTLRRSKTDQAGAGSEDRHTVRVESRHMPGSHNAIVDRTGCDQRRAAVPVNQPAWAGSAGRAVRYRRGTGGEETGGAGWARLGEVCRAQPAVRARHQCGNCRGIGTVHHESNGAPQRADGAEVHPGGESVPGEQRGEAGVVECTHSLQSLIILFPLLGFCGYFSGRSGPVGFFLMISTACSIS